MKTDSSNGPRKQRRLRDLHNGDAVFAVRRNIGDRSNGQGSGRFGSVAEHFSDRRGVVLLPCNFCKYSRSAPQVYTTCLFICNSIIDMV